MYVPEAMKNYRYQLYVVQQQKEINIGKNKKNHSILRELGLSSINSTKTNITFQQKQLACSDTAFFNAESFPNYVFVQLDLSIMWYFDKETK